MRDANPEHPAASTGPDRSTLIDRIAPTRAPEQAQVLWQTWADLLFVHWELPAEVLAPHLPRGLTLDTFEGRAFVGVVPFTMKDIRPVYLPAVPGISDFHETNVRTYVHVEGRDPGVWFFSLDAASRLGVFLGRSWFKLPYHHARMDLVHGDGEIRHDTQRSADPKARCHARYTPRGPVRTAEPCTLEHFLLERYILYTQRGGALVQGRVHHTPYPFQDVALHELDETLVAAAGVTRPEGPPALRHYSSGVRVRIYPLTQVRGVSGGAGAAGAG